MKHTGVLLTFVMVFAVLMIQAEEVDADRLAFNGPVVDGGKFIMDWQDFKVQFSNSKDKFYIASKYYLFQINESECHEFTFLKICTEGINTTDSGQKVLNIKGWIKECVDTYPDDRGIPVCTQMYGATCTNNFECFSRYCTHGICTPNATYCGDKYCDEGEDVSNCFYDCKFVEDKIEHLSNVGINLTEPWVPEENKTEPLLLEPVVEEEVYVKPVQEQPEVVTLNKFWMEDKIFLQYTVLSLASILILLNIAAVTRSVRG